MARPAPAVSVCIPCYNGAAWLAPCLHSVLAQTHADFEVLLVDSGSTDHTLEIGRRFAALDARVRIVEAESRIGMVPNWNRAIGLARGDWVKLVFQDDLLMPRCIEGLLAHANRHDALFVACLRQFRVEGPLKKWIQDFYRANRKLIASLYPRGRLGAEEVAALALARFGYNFVGEPTTTLIHRKVFDAVGVFDPALVQRVDTEFWLRAGLHFGIAMVPQELAVFRVHGGSASAANEATRTYADRWLDVALILDHFLFDPLYEPLRAKANGLAVLGKLQVRYDNLCRRAGAMARDATGAGAQTMRDDWQRVIAQRPRIAQAAAGLAAGHEPRAVPL